MGGRKLTSTLTPCRGEIWLVNLEHTVGNEISKTRPAAIVNSNHIGVLELRIVTPITSWQPMFDNKPWFVKINRSPQNSLNNDSVADAFQVKSISINRFIKQLGTLDADDLEELEEALKLVMELN
jgi:mRNA interferase MazF